LTGRVADAATRKGMGISGRDPEEARVGTRCRKDRERMDMLRGSTIYCSSSGVKIWTTGL
jgi:hypothetical protein